MLSGGSLSGVVSVLGRYPEPNLVPCLTTSLLGDVLPIEFRLLRDGGSRKNHLYVAWINAAGQFFKIEVEPALQLARCDIAPAHHFLDLGISAAHGYQANEKA